MRTIESRAYAKRWSRRERCPVSANPAPDGDEDVCKTSDKRSELRFRAIAGDNRSGSRRTRNQLRTSAAGLRAINVQAAQKLKKLGTTVRTWVTFTDIILGGGYVDPQARFPPDTEMELTLDLNVIRVHTRAVVRVTYPFLGMGLASTEMAPDERSRLEQMVGALGG